MEMVDEVEMMATEVDVEKQPRRALVAHLGAVATWNVLDIQRY
jgi:hypothetical protein